MDNQLINLINDNGLDKTKSQVLLDNFSGYFELASDWEKKANMLVITSVEQKAEMKMAGEGRKFLKDKRVAVEHTRKALKENSLREGQTIDAIAKVLTNLIIPIEKDLEEKEKFAERQEARRIEALNDERTREIEPYFEYVPYGIEFGKMAEDDYKKVLSGAKLQKEAADEAERKAEQERIAREKAEEEERQRIRLENERLKKEAEEKEKQLAEERAKVEAEKRAAEEKAKKEREVLEEKVRKEREAQEKRLEEERAKAAAERKAIEDKARLEREENERLLKIERDKQAKIEAERIAEANRIEAERKAKGDAEKKAKSAPDKEKLLAFAVTLSKLDMPTLVSDEAKVIIENVKILLIKTEVYINDHAKKL